MKKDGIKKVWKLTFGMGAQEISENKNIVTIKEAKTADMPDALRVLSLVKNSQQKHGLRHENYQRYRWD